MGLRAKSGFLGGMHYFVLSAASLCTSFDILVEMPENRSDGSTGLAFSEIQDGGRQVVNITVLPPFLYCLCIPSRSHPPNLNSTARLFPLLTVLWI